VNNELEECEESGHGLTGSTTTALIWSN
jgi:hypothetical protein